MKPQLPMGTFSRIAFAKEPWAVDWETFMGRRGDISSRGPLLDGGTVFIFNKPPTTQMEHIL